MRVSYSVLEEQGRKRYAVLKEALEMDMYQEHDAISDLLHNFIAKGIIVVIFVLFYLK